MKNTAPSSFSPSRPADLIGGAARIAKILARKASELADGTPGNLKVLLYGAPGVGKTCVANMVARIIGSRFTLESVNGRSVNVDLVRAWQGQTHYTNLFGGFTVKIVDELDTCPTAAQDLLLTYLDTMPNGFAFLGTSNLDLGQLVPRLQTRLQHYKVETPATSEIVNMLRKGWRLPENTAHRIAVGSGGNVRAALLDAESYLDVELARS